MIGTFLFEAIFINSQSEIPCGLSPTVYCRLCWTAVDLPRMEYR